MKMPEGWQKQFDRFQDSIYLNLSQPAQMEYSKALFLMKEMAEALKDCCLSEPDKINWGKANRVLEKFREWK